MNKPHLPPKAEIALFNNGLYHHGREIAMGAKNYLLKHSNVQLRVLHDTNYLTLADSALANPDLVSFSAAIAVDTPDALIEQLQKITPVIVNASPESSIQSLPAVIIDDVEVGRMAADYYIRRRYKSFAYIQKAGLPWSQRRNAGFVARLHEEGYRPIQVDRTEDSEWCRPVANLPKPLAVFAPSDGLARILIEQLIDLNIHIPRDVAVLGVDDDPYQNSLSPVPLSSIQLPGSRIGEIAAEQLLLWIEMKKKPQAVRKLKPVRVITRLSTDNAYCDDELVAEALDIINEQLPDLKSTDDLVQRLKVSRRTLEWRFRKELGHTIHDELSHARIENARLLLSTTDLTGEQIAQRVGLSEGRMLTLLLKRKTGQTPTEYREGSTD
jgi:LacI family transcriptional regulator